MIRTGKQALFIRIEEIVSTSRNTGYNSVGEISSSVLKEICFENQRFKRITVSDAEKTTELLEILEGKNVEPRKQFIYENATSLGFNFV